MKQIIVYRFEWSQYYDIWYTKKNCWIDIKILKVRYFNLGRFGKGIRAENVDTV